MKKKRWVGLLLVNGALLLLVIVWSIPTFGLLVSSFRSRFDIQTSGWWTVFPHREWVTVAESDPKVLGLDPDGVMEVEGVTGTFDQLREGVASPDGNTRVTWVGNRRLGRIEVQRAGVDGHLGLYAGQLQAGAHRKELGSPASPMERLRLFKART